MYAPPPVDGSASHLSWHRSSNVCADWVGLGSALLEAPDQRHQSVFVLLRGGVGNHVQAQGKSACRRRCRDACLRRGGSGHRVQVVAYTPRLMSSFSVVEKAGHVWPGTTWPTRADITVSGATAGTSDAKINS